MFGPFSFSGAHSARNGPSVGSATRARGYARHYLWNTTVFWGATSLACIAALGFLALGEHIAEGAIGPAGGCLVRRALPAGRPAPLFVLENLPRPPGPGRGARPPSRVGVASKASSIFWNKLAFLEEKYHLEIVRGVGMRPLTLGSGEIVQEGWFLAAQGYHDLLAPGDQVRGTLYPRTRVIDALVKV